MKKLLAAAIAITLAACSHSTPTPSANQLPPVVPSSQPQVAPSITSSSATLVAASENIPNPSGQWTPIDSDVSGALVSVDPNTASRQGNIVRFWQKRVLAMPDQFGASIYLNYQSLDCVNGVFQFHKDIYLAGDGSLLNQGVGDSPVQLITPGSLGESISRGVCVAIH
jgi:hypothetical protein